MKEIALMITVISVFAFGCTGFTDVNTDAADQFDRELANIDAYLKANNIQAKIDSAFGIRYVIGEQGNDTVPSLADSILVNFRGNVLNDSKAFDEGDSVKFLLNELLDGWRASLHRIGEGGDITIYFPSFYGYRQRQVGSIPPNSTLVFEIELIDVIKKAQ